MSLGIKILQNPNFVYIFRKQNKLIARNGDHIIAIQVNICKVTGIMKSQRFPFSL